MIRIGSTIWAGCLFAVLLAALLFCSTQSWGQSDSSILQPRVINRKPDSIIQPLDETKVEKNQVATDTNSNSGPTQNTSDNDLDWINDVQVGYDGGFVIASKKPLDLGADKSPFELRINGWGQLRHTIFDSDVVNPDQRDVNQFQLKRGRIVFSGNVFNEDFSYFVQMDGRSSSGDDIRLLDYFLAYDLGHRNWGFKKGVLALQTGKFKMPFSMSRDLSGREFEFTDRSMASIFFDVNRSFGWGLYGRFNGLFLPWNWETAIFNGFVTGGAETGSAGTLDNNFGYSLRLHTFPWGEWGAGSLADFDWHQTLATRFGMAVAQSDIDRVGSTEFNSIRVVDSGERLSSLLPDSVLGYNVVVFAVDHSFKYRGWSGTVEYYFRNVGGLGGAGISDLYDHGYWLQAGRFVIPNKLQLMARWSRVVGNSGSLGRNNLSSDEYAAGFAWYIRDQNAKFVMDITRIESAPINSSALDMNPGNTGWLVRSQVQFAF